MEMIERDAGDRVVKHVTIVVEHYECSMLPKHHEQSERVRSSLQEEHTLGLAPELILQSRKSRALNSHRWQISVSLEGEDSYK